LEQIHHILIDENIPYLSEVLSYYGVIGRFSGRNLTNEELIQSQCDILYVRSTAKVNKELLKNTNVKFVGTATSGIEHIDTEYLRKAGIYFASASGSNANSVAELVIYSILKWSRITGRTLKNETIGIIGYGNIGKIVAKVSSYIGLQALANDPFLKDANFNFPDFVKYSDLKSLLSGSDIITNHIPLTTNTNYPTHHLISDNEIDKIKNSSLFIHTSRGGVVNELSLINRLRKKSVFLAIDVWENEPLINTELAKMCMLATPHIGGYSRDGKLRGVKMMIDAFQKFTGVNVESSIIQKELEVYHPVEQSSYSNLDHIYNLLKQSRQFDDDHKSLLQTLELPEKERAMQFDLLRKNYPIRRESL